MMLAVYSVNGLQPRDKAAVKTIDHSRKYHNIP